MNASPGWIEKEILETFYLIVEEYRRGSIDQRAFFDKIFMVADRYARHADKEEVNRNQMTLFAQ